MLVWADGQSGTIGGGTLEFEATRAARAMLETNDHTRIVRQPLGPALGQCCGGSMTLLTELFDAESIREAERQIAIDGRYTRSLSSGAGTQTERPAKFETGPLVSFAYHKGWVSERIERTRHAVWVYGAGHVGRALVALLDTHPEFEVTWVDFDSKRYPAAEQKSVIRLVAANPADATGYAPDDAMHVVVTHSHALDLDICGRLLPRPTRFIGLIGSSTKWARFRKRLAEAGHTNANIDRIQCPIGDISLGKHPESIAIGIAAKLLSVNQE